MMLVIETIWGGSVFPFSALKDIFMVPCGRRDHSGVGYMCRILCPLKKENIQRWQGAIVINGMKDCSLIHLPCNPLRTKPLRWSCILVIEHLFYFWNLQVEWWKFGAFLCKQGRAKLTDAQEGTRQVPVSFLCNANKSLFSWQCSFLPRALGRKIKAKGRLVGPTSFTGRKTCEATKQKQNWVAK